MRMQKKSLRRLTLFAWFIFSLSGQSAVEEGKLISPKPYPTREECVAVARLFQGQGLAPFFYCVGSHRVRELPPLINQQFKLLIDGLEKR